MDEFHNPESPVVEDEFETESTLYSAPSFEIYNNSHGEFGDDDNDPEEALKRTALLVGQSLKGTDSGEFTFGWKKMDLIEEGENENDLPNGIQNLSVEEEDVEPASPPMYLAAGLGVDGNGTAFGGEVVSDDIFIPNLQESEDLEEYYNKKVDEYPSHPLILKKYAQFLQ
ncbi:hypothetical protein SESBI_48363, partial [Sesbania bispinosa]